MDKGKNGNVGEEGKAAAEQFNFLGGEITGGEIPRIAGND